MPTTEQLQKYQIVFTLILASAAAFFTWEAYVLEFGPRTVGWLALKGASYGILADFFMEWLFSVGRKGHFAKMGASLYQAVFTTGGLIVLYELVQLLAGSLDSVSTNRFVFACMTIAPGALGSLAMNMLWVGIFHPGEDDESGEEPDDEYAGDEAEATA